MNRSQLLDGNMGVDLSCRKIRVAQKRLNETDVSAVLEHVRRTSVAHQVTGARCREARVHHMALHEITHAVFREGLAVVGEEEGVGTHVARKARPHVHSIAMQPRDRSGDQWHDSVPPTFAAAHVYGLRNEVHVIEAQPHELHPAKGGAVEELQDRSVADAAPSRGIGLSNDGFYLYPRRNTGWQPADLPGEYEPQARVAWDSVLANEPPTERNHRIEPRGLSACSQGMAIGLAPRRQVMLIMFQHGMRDGA